MPEKHIPYFRFYPADFMNSVRGMSAQEVGTYMMLLCRMYEENGPIEYHPLRLSTYCGMREKTFVAVAEKLIDLGKIEQVDGWIFNERARKEIQSRSDDLKNNSKAGKASAKKRQQKQQPDPTPVERTFNHTDTDTDTDTDTYKGDTKVSLVLFAPEPPNSVSECVGIYNDAADFAGWPRVQKVTPARSRALKSRLSECGGVNGWRAAIDKAKASDFLCGKTDRPWIGCGFDWITKQANFTKLMEGNYDNANNTGHGNSARDAAAVEIAFAARAARAPNPDWN